MLASAYLEDIVTSHERIRIIIINVYANIVRRNHEQYNIILLSVFELGHYIEGEENVRTISP